MAREQFATAKPVNARLIDKGIKEAASRIDDRERRLSVDTCVANCKSARRMDSGGRERRMEWARLNCGGATWSW